MYSCVSAKKYETLNNRYEYIVRTRVADTTRLSMESERHIQERDSIAIKYNRQVNAYLQLKNDSTTLAQNYYKNKKMLDDLFEKYDQLDKSYKQLSASLSSEDVSIAQNVSQKEKDLLIQEQKVLAQQANNDKLAASLQEREIKMLAFESSMRKMEKSVGDLKKKLEKSVLSSKDTAVTIEQRMTKLAIVFPESYGFASNTTNLSPQGVDLLKKIASILKIQPEYTITPTSLLIQSGGKDMVGEELSKSRIWYVAETLKKEGVTFSRISVSIKYQTAFAEQTKKTEKQPRTPLIEISIQPKLDSVFQMLQAD
ncbi:hypothetical protein QNI16_02840 [Cytophagaceae bacterium YF14B1]|uniref:OmpA-like domain-containing protein n=1 Tax=Xanthocytophaga flava TaxID=3048013 RepID=A0AAE3U785_9BACT|nr:hypothetical protein [Xanthocytophaga flavus]MDJ1479404.1 hypothetical protein [Xanthocytophaga flavus]